MFRVVAYELLSSFPSLDIIAQAPIAPMEKPRHCATILAPHGPLLRRVLHDVARDLYSHSVHYFSASLHDTFVVDLVLGCSIKPVQSLPILSPDHS
jgi:hypothetical protein